VPERATDTAAAAAIAVGAFSGFPLAVLIIPLFIVMRRSGLLGSYVGLIAACLAFTVPLAVWILRDFIETIPVELEEAALVDGATRFTAMVRIVLPLALPALATTAMFSFINVSNEFMFALTSMNEESKETLPVVLQTFVGRAQTDWAAVMATSVIYTLPVIALFALLRKHLVTGLTSGALKG
jgi:N,N'-diacetylchitobiose transport system permease protein